MARIPLSYDRPAQHDPQPRQIGRHRTHPNQRPFMVPTNTLVSERILANHRHTAYCWMRTTVRPIPQPPLSESHPRLCPTNQRQRVAAVETLSTPTWNSYPNGHSTTENKTGKNKQPAKEWKETSSSPPSDTTNTPKLPSKYAKRVPSNNDAPSSPSTTRLRSASGADSTPTKDNN
jgi:hypothetical protein